MGRGQLTPEIQKIAQFRIGREISLRELRLLPYIDYTMKNSQRIEPIRINQEEREILKKYREAGYIEGGASGLSITRDFYNFIQEVLWEGYVLGGAESVSSNKSCAEETQP
jgi:hypothetical protein